jgi:methylmalonyl-CoA epimerase
MTKWIDHIVVRVNDLDASLEDYQSKLGMQVKSPPEDYPTLGMRSAAMAVGDEGRFVELAAPLGEGAISKALEKYGEGLHVVALAVDDLAAETAKMKANGARVIESGSQVFIHPKDGHGVMYQLVERPLTH